MLGARDLTQCTHIVHICKTYPNDLIYLITTQFQNRIRLEQHQRLSPNGLRQKMTYEELKVMDTYNEVEELWLKSISEYVKEAVAVL